MNTSHAPHRRSTDDADRVADPTTRTSPAPSEQQVRARAAFLFRDAVQAGQLHPLMPLFIRYRLQQEAL